MTATLHERLAAGGEPGDFCTIGHITLRGDQASSTPAWPNSPNATTAPAFRTR